MTLEELQAQRDKLMASMSRSESSIEFEQRRTEFRSWDEMKAQLDWLDGQIAAMDGTAAETKFTRVRYVSTCKDLC